jgi:hypothetical protein
MEMKYSALLSFVLGGGEWSASHSGEEASMPIG